MVSIIAAIGKKRELGKDNQLIWSIPDDLKRFQQITTGHPIIMGRKTFESIGRPLPKRTNIVVSTKQIPYEGIHRVTSVEEALLQAKTFPGNQEVFVIGGGQLYEQTINLADRLYLTVIDATAEADTFFPDYSQFTHVIEEIPTHDNRLSYSYLTLQR